MQNSTNIQYIVNNYVFYGGLNSEFMIAARKEKPCPHRK
jgi:hypothetical protein